MVEWPDWSLLAVVIHLASRATAFAIGPLSRSGLLPMRYSKFRTGQHCEPVGVVVMFGTPIVTLLVAALAAGAPSDAGPAQLMVMGALTAHFAKRVVESLFVHVYSGPIDLVTVVLISVNYALVAAVTALALHDAPAVNAALRVGAALFVAGEAGNLYHHVLLARLRRGRSGYFIPRGGLFELVSTPHYLFELVS